MRVRGRINRWNDDKGFGFITPLNGSQSIFMHISAFNSRGSRPVVGGLVTYTPSSDRHGRPCAIDVSPTGEQPVASSVGSRVSRPLMLSGLFLSALALSAFLGQIPLQVFGGYLVLGVITFSAYGLDKRAARRGKCRTRESTLHLLALLGGWPGALVAQQTLRHKSSKHSFRLVFWITVILNLAIVLWFHTAEGRRYLESVFG